MKYTSSLRGFINRDHLEVLIMIGKIDLNIFRVVVDRYSNEIKYTTTRTSFYFKSILNKDIKLGLKGFQDKAVYTRDDRTCI